MSFDLVFVVGLNILGRTTNPLPVKLTFGGEFAVEGLAKVFDHQMWLCSVYTVISCPSSSAIVSILTIVVVVCSNPCSLPSEKKIPNSCYHTSHFYHLD